MPPQFTPREAGGANNAPATGDLTQALLRTDERLDEKQWQHGSESLNYIVYTAIRTALAILREEIGGRK